MFERAVLEVLRNRIADSPINKIVTPDDIVITAEDEPPPTIGQYFVLIYPAQRDNQAESGSVTRSPNYVSERIGIDIVCGARTRLSPTDRLGTYLTKEYMNLSILKDTIVTFVSKLNSSQNMVIRDTILNLLKDYDSSIQDILREDISIGYGFEYLNVDAQPSKKFPEYFKAYQSSEVASERPAAHTYTCRFLSPSRNYGVQC